jgi:hypothetical protein
MSQFIFCRRCKYANVNEPRRGSIYPAFAQKGPGGSPPGTPDQGDVCSDVPLEPRAAPAAPACPTASGPLVSSPGRTIETSEQDAGLGQHKRTNPETVGPSLMAAGKDARMWDWQKAELVLAADPSVAAAPLRGKTKPNAKAGGEQHNSGHPKASACKCPRRGLQKAANIRMSMNPEGVRYLSTGQRPGATYHGRGHN